MNETVSARRSPVEASEEQLRKLGSRRTRRVPIGRLVPLAFALGIIAAVALGLWNAANPPEGEAPAALGSYGRTTLDEGPQAVAQMSRLHGKGVGVVDGYIAHYQGANGGLVAYVGETASSADAVALNQQMEERIAAGNQYFTGLKAMTVEGTRVLSVRSGPETHYFWAVGTKVIWLAFDRDDAATLSAAVRAFK